MKRYAWYEVGGFIEHNLGPWVKFEDAQKAMEKLVFSAQTVLKKWESTDMNWQDSYVDLEDEMTALKIDVERWTAPKAKK
jgi:hypothetical protein